MVLKIVISFCFVAAATAAAIPAVPLTKLAYAEPELPAQYEYSYSVQDDHSGDVKQQKENRNGDSVHGFYSLVQPDGTLRIVEYTADKEHGFNAVVRYEGQPRATPAKIVHAAPSPVAYTQSPPQVAYAPVPAQVAYAPAPAAKVAYAQAPVANYSPVPYASAAPVAYAPAPFTKVAYASPVPVAYPRPEPVAYAATPVPHVAYAQSPRVAYSAPLGHVTYSSPAYSYQH